MKTMKKEFECRGFHFTITVELNYIEKFNIHRATIVSTDAGYDESVKILNKHLAVMIINCENQARKWMDDKIDGKLTPEYILSELGYK